MGMTLGVPYGAFLPRAMQRGKKPKSLALRIYRESEGSPKSEIYGLTSQLRPGLLFR